MEIGRVCCKTMGREANKICVVVDVVDDKFVVIDGDVRRKKCNIQHLEPLEQVIEINKNDSTEKVKSVLEKAGFKISKKGEAREKKPRQREHKKKGTSLAASKKEK